MSAYYHKICSIWCYEPKYEPLNGQCESWYVWTRVVPRLADPEVKTMSPAVEIPSARSKDKGERWIRTALLPDASPKTGSRARWPRGHIPVILPSDSDVLVSLQRTDVRFTTCVAEGRRRRSFDIIVLSHFQTRCGLNSGESLYESLWSSSM